MAGIIRTVDDDDVFGPTREGQTPIPQKSEVSGVEPAVVSEDLSVRLGVLVVSHGHHGTLDMEVPNLSLRQGAVIFINNAQANISDRPTKLHKGIVVASRLYREAL